MLTAEQIDKNRTEFISLVRQINIPGADIEGLLNWLDNSDFYYAPASAQYHNSFDGGLCAHSLTVYKQLVNLVYINQTILPAYDNNSLLVVGLLHDLSKTNFYEPYTINKKKYYAGGTKKDNLGNFDWYSEQAFKIKEANERFLGGTHEFNSMMLVNKYIPLNYEESISILHHHFGMSDKNPPADLSAIANKYPLVTLLHLADMSATYLNERTSLNETQPQKIQGKF